MELDGKEELVVLRAFQMHPYKPQVMHIDFQRIAPDEKGTIACRCTSPAPKKARPSS